MIYKYLNKKTYLAIVLVILTAILLVIYLNFNEKPYKNLDNNSLKEAITLKKSSISPIPTPAVRVKKPQSQYQLTGGTHAFQTFNNCGPASLSMTLSFYEVFVSQKVLGSELRPFQNPVGDNDDKSVTLDEIAEKAKEFGFLTYHRPNGNINLLKTLIANDIPVLARTLLHINDDIGHYRVVYGYDDLSQELIQNDSMQGKNLRFSYNGFLALWKPFSYEYLVLVPAEKKEIAEIILGQDVDEQQSWNNAVTRLQQEIATEPNDINLKFSLSVALYNIGEYQKSVEEFEKVEHLLPFRTLWYQIEPLLAYQKLKSYDQLLLRIEKILMNGNRAFSELYQIRGDIYLELGKTDAAQQEFEKVIYYNRNFKSPDSSNI